MQFHDDKRICKCRRVSLGHLSHAFLFRECHHAIILKMNKDQLYQAFNPKKNQNQRYEKLKPS